MQSLDCAGLVARAEDVCWLEGGRVLDFKPFPATAVPTSHATEPCAHCCMHSYRTPRSQRVPPPLLHRTRAPSDEAVVLDMGLWQRQQLPPTTPTSPAPTSAAAAATAAFRTSLPGAMPPPNLFGRDHHHPNFSLPVSPSSSANGGYPSHDGGVWGPIGGFGGGWGAAAGGWGLWGSGAASTAGGGGYGGAHSCATAGSGSEHGATRLRLYQVGWVVNETGTSGVCAWWGS